MVLCHARQPLGSISIKALIPLLFVGANTPSEHDEAQSAQNVHPRFEKSSLGGSLSPFLIISSGQDATQVGFSQTTHISAFEASKKGAEGKKRSSSFFCLARPVRRPKKSRLLVILVCYDIFVYIK
jgi:hypothetical protein